MKNTENVDCLDIYFNSLEKPLLDEKKQRELLKQIKEGNVEATEEFIEKNLRLVLPVAFKNLGRGLELADLIQEGNIGLMEAVKRFDLTRSNRFSTYAVWWIRQAISRAVDEQSQLIRRPVHYCEAVNKIKKISNFLAQKNNGEEPTKSQLAKALNITVEQLERIYDLNHEVISMNMSISPDKDSENKRKDELGDFMSTEEGLPLEELENKDRLDRVMNVMQHCLNEREIEVLKLRYGFGDNEPKTLEEVGKEFNLTRERIRQIEAKALKKIRSSRSIKQIQDYRPAGYEKNY